MCEAGSIGDGKTWPSSPGAEDSASVMPKSVSDVPSETPMSPGSNSPRPATEHGLSPDQATTAHVGSKPYLGGGARREGNEQAPNAKQGGAVGGRSVDAAST